MPFHLTFNNIRIIFNKTVDCSFIYFLGSFSGFILNSWKLFSLIVPTYQIRFSFNAHISFKLKLERKCQQMPLNFLSLSNRLLFLNKKIKWWFTLLTIRIPKVFFLKFWKQKNQWHIYWSKTWRDRVVGPLIKVVIVPFWNKVGENKTESINCQILSPYQQHFVSSFATQVIFKHFKDNLAQLIWNNFKEKNHLV